MSRPLSIALLVIVILAAAVTAVVATRPERGQAPVGVPAPTDAGLATVTPAIYIPRTAQPAAGTPGRLGSGSAVALQSVLNYQVRDSQGQNVGILDNLLLDLGNDTVAYAFISLGKGVQSTNRLYPVPLNVLKLDRQARVLTLNADPKILASAPYVTREDLANGKQLPLPGDVRPFFGSGATEMGSGARPGISGTPTPPAQPGGPLSGSPTPAAGGAGPQVPAAQVIGFDVWNRPVDQPSTKVGSIQDLIVDFSTERVNYAVVATGNPTSPDKKLIPVPVSALKLDQAGKVFLLNADARVIDSAPGFGQDRWPDLSQPGWDAQFQSFWQTPSVDKAATPR